MGSTEKFCIKWNDFEANISSAFHDLKEEKLVKLVKPVKVLKLINLVKLVKLENLGKHFKT